MIEHFEGGVPYYLLDLLFAENTHNATSLLLVAVLVHTH